MDQLKVALTTPPALMPIDYLDEAGSVLLSVDASLTGGGAVLEQMYGKKRKPSRYESGIWSDAEQKYDTTKRKYRGVLKAVRKFRYWLYDVRFILETDARVLVAQLNQSGTDLPGALVTRWLAYINLFDFDIKHVPGKSHTAADGLSRRLATAFELQQAKNEPDIEEILDAKLNCLFVTPGTINKDILVLEDGFSEESIQIALYLTSLQRPVGMSPKEFQKFKAKALHYKVVDRVLFWRNTKNVPMKRVVDSEAEKSKIMTALHDESGHQGQEGTYRKIADRYWWDDMHAQVKSYV